MFVPEIEMICNNFRYKGGVEISLYIVSESGVATIPICFCFYYFKKVNLVDQNGHAFFGNGQNMKLMKPLIMEPKHHPVA